LVFLESVKNSSRKFDLKKGDYVNKKICVTNEMVDELENLIQVVFKQISSLEFDKLPEKDPKKCLMCAFSSICWE